MEGFDEIFWHDSEIESVVERPAKDELIFNVQYPIDWDNNLVAPKSIIFKSCFSYEVAEMPFEGNPTILSAVVLAEVGTLFQQGGYYKVHLETNAGERYITAKSITLKDRDGVI